MSELPGCCLMICIRMSSQNVIPKFQFRMSSQNITLKCHLRMSPRNVISEYHPRMSSQNVIIEIRMSSQNVILECDILYLVTFFQKCPYLQLVFIERLVHLFSEWVSGIDWLGPLQFGGRTVTPHYALHVACRETEKQTNKQTNNVKK